MTDRFDDIEAYDAGLLDGPRRQIDWLWERRLSGGIDYKRWTPLVKPAPREAFADRLDLLDEEDR